ncbi:putative quinol monooxygenase [Streptomyces hoynatensis]|nr:putative quinol monooxygenase [Streptomyces hoynatensis]
MRTRPGRREEVAALLLRSASALSEAGCRSYVVSLSEDDADAIWVTEVWESREAHDASLRLPEAQAAIAEAMPLLTGEFTRQETKVLGGLGA